MDISVKRIEIDRAGEDGLICQDNLRADIKVAFFVRVNKETEDVARVAESFDNEDQLKAEDVILPASAPPLFADETPQLPVAVDVPPVVIGEPSWYSFWNPFRSEIAANGFVTQLEKVTGIDYRVVKVETGVYEVAFAYNDDAERKAKLSQISVATGLDLPDS